MSYGNTPNCDRDDEQLGCTCGDGYGIISCPIHRNPETYEQQWIESKQPDYRPENFPRHQKHKQRKTVNTKTDKTNSIIRLENVRLSYAALDKPKGMEGSEPKFSAVLLLDKKEHADLIQRLDKLKDRVALDMFGKKVPLKHPLLRDGAEKEDTEGYGEKIMFITAKSDARPAVVDGQRNSVVKGDAHWPYSGCYVNASINIFAWKNEFGKGVSASLRAIQFVKDGPSFGAAKVNPEDEFETVEATGDEY